MDCVVQSEIRSSSANTNLTNGSGRIVAIGIVNHAEGTRRSSRAGNVFASPNRVVETEVREVVGRDERAVWADPEGRWSS